MTIKDLNLTDDELQRYAGYTDMPEFKRGFEDWRAGLHRAGWNLDGVAAQAWDRGAECAMRRQRAQLNR